LVAKKDIKKNNVKTPIKIKLLKIYEVAIKAIVFNINTLLTNLFAFDQINISGTGYFETINDVINIALVRDEVDLRYDSLDIDFTNASNEAISIDLDATATDTYNASKSVNGVNVETTVIGVDNGDASFSIAGTLEGGNTLSISEDSADPDGGNVTGTANNGGAAD